MPGHILSVEKEGLWVQTGSGPLVIETLQPPGKPKMSARDWANGALKTLTTPQFLQKPIDSNGN